MFAEKMAEINEHVAPSEAAYSVEQVCKYFSCLFKRYLYVKICLKIFSSSNCCYILLVLEFHDSNTFSVKIPFRTENWSCQ